MTTKKKSYGGLAILTAVGASLCCLTPVLALLGGFGGIAATFSWLEPFRPYLIGLTVAVLGFAWYRKLQPAKEIDCDCEDEKTPFLQTKFFLGLVTVFASLMLAFPYYSNVFYPKNSAQNVQLQAADIEIAEFNIEGMTCTGCEEHITHAVNELAGIQSVKASYVEGYASVQFDKTVTNPEEIIEAINATGYKVKD